MEPVTKQAIIEHKIGRNLILYQKIEYIVTFLIASCKVHGLSENEQQTHENVVAEPSGDQPREASVSTSLTLQKNDYLRLQAQLTEVTEKRNELVQYILPMLYPDVPEKLLFVENYLDSQQEKIQPTLKDLLSLFNAYQEGREDVFQVLLSKEYQRSVAYHDIWGSIVQSLFDIARESTEDQGWVSIAYADKILHDRFPEWMTVFSKLHNIDSLTELVMNIEAFDLRTSSNDTGNSTCFRIKDEFRSVKSIRVSPKGSLDNRSIIWQY